MALDALQALILSRSPVKQSFDVNERVQLIDDMFHMAETGELPVAYALDTLEYIRDEESYLPWRFAVKHLKRLIAHIEDDSSSTYVMLRVSRALHQPQHRHKVMLNCACN